MRNYLFTILIHIITSFLSMYWNRRKEIKEDKKLFIALMIGGFVWSQLQTEYLILRIRKQTNDSLNSR